MRRGTVLGAAVIGVLLLAGATGFAARTFAAGNSVGDVPATSAVAQEQIDMNSADCPFVDGDVDAMQSHMDSLHGDGSFAAMWAHGELTHKPGTFGAMHDATGEMMGN